MNTEFLKSDENRCSAETLDFITKAFSDCGIEIRIREEEVRCGSSLTYYPYDILSGREKIGLAKSKGTGDLDWYITGCFGGDKLNGCVRINQDGLEIPNVHRNPPPYESLLKTPGWKKAAANRDCIPILLGESVTGDAFVCELSHSPDAYAVQMLAGGGLGAGMTQLLQNVVTALHTCRTPDDLEIYILHRSLGYYAFKDSHLVLRDTQTSEVEEAVGFMKSINGLLKERLCAIRDNPNSKFKDILVIVDDYDDFRGQNSDLFRSFKQLLEECVVSGRSAKMHFIVGVNEAGEDILKTDIYTSFFSLRSSSKNSWRVLGNERATDLKKGGEGLFRAGDYSHRVLIPLLSTDEQKRYVNAMMNKSVPHVAATPEKHERSEKTKKLVAEIRALSEEVARKEALVRKLEARQGQAIQALKAIVEAGNSVAEPQNKGEAAKGNNGSCGQIELLPVPDSKRNGVLKLFAPMSGEECFNRAATLYNSKDYPKALRWFCKSADRGCTEGQYCAGWMLAWGDEGVPQNGRKAESYLTCAAEKGHVDAMIQLAFLYEDGRGIEKSPVQALHWFTLAAARHSWAGEQGVQRLKAVQ